jgi:hypothetical protein
MEWEGVGDCSSCFENTASIQSGTVMTLNQLNKLQCGKLELFIVYFKIGLISRSLSGVSEEKRDLTQNIYISVCGVMIPCNVDVLEEYTASIFRL